MKRAILVSLYEAACLAGQIVYFLFWGYYFGTSPEMDAYWVSATLPMILIAVFTEPLVASLVPILVERRLKAPQADIEDFQNNLFNLTLLAGGLLTLLLCAGAGVITRLLAPGLPPATRALAESLLRIRAISLPLRLSAGLLTSFYYARERYYLPTAMPAFGTAAAIIFLVLFQGSMGIYALAWSSLFEALVQWVPLIPIMRRYSPKFRPRDPGLRKLASSMLPLVGGSAYFKSDSLVDRIVASFLPAGSISSLGYGFRMASAVNQVISRGFITTRFKELAEHRISSAPEFRKSVNRLILQVVYVTVPCLITLFLFIRPLISFFLERGRFTGLDTARVASIILAFSGMILFGLLGSIMATCFYSIQDTKSLTLIGVVVFTLGIGLKILGAASFSYLGVAAATSVYYFLAFAAQMIVFQRKTGVFEFAGLASATLRMATAGAATFAAGLFLRRWAVPDMARILLGIGLVFSLYFAATLALGVDEPRNLWRKARGFALRRGGNPRSG